MKKKAAVTPIRTRRVFWNRWDEVDYLYFKAGHWIYVGGRPARAKSFIRRLKCLTAGAPNDSVSVVSVRGLIAAWEGDLRSELRYKRREVEFLLRLVELATDYPGCRPCDALDEMEILALLLEDNKRRTEALKMVESCEAFARKYKLAFKASALRARILE